MPSGARRGPSLARRCLWLAGVELRPPPHRTGGVRAVPPRQAPGTGDGPRRGPRRVPGGGRRAVQGRPRPGAPPPPQARARGRSCRHRVVGRDRGGLRRPRDLEVGAVWRHRHVGPLRAAVDPEGPRRLAVEDGTGVCRGGGHHPCRRAPRRRPPRPRRPPQPLVVVPGLRPGPRLVLPWPHLLLDLAELAVERGLSTIDLGRGEHGYKLRVATGTDTVAEGVVPAE